MALRTLVNENWRLSDLVKWEVNQLFCRASLSIKNIAAGAVVLLNPMGYPIGFSSGTYNLMFAGGESTAVGLIISDKNWDSLAGGATRPYKTEVLLYGPAVISKDIIPTTDASGGTINVTTVMTALLARGIHNIDVPPQSTVATA